MTLAVTRRSGNHIVSLEMQGEGETAMPRSNCRVCEARPRHVITVTVERGPYRRMWSVGVCRDCWRAFEAMLDEGALGMQASLADQERLERGRLWFL